MLKKFWILAVVLLIANILSCSSSSKQNPPESTPSSANMSVDDFVDIYVQLSLAAEEYLADSLALVNTQNLIFEESGYTREEFNAFEKEMDNMPERWEKIWQRIMDQLEEIKAKEEEKTNSEEGTQE